MISSPSDSSLVSSFLANNEQAFSQLFDRHAEPLWRYAYRHSYYKDEPFIDDIQSEVFKTILRKLKEGGAFEDKGPGSFKAWAYKICLQITLDANRRFKQRAVPLSQQFPDEMPDDLTDERSESPSADMEKSEESAKLHAVLDKFTPEDQQLITLALIEDMPYDEIVKIPPFDRYKDKLPALRQRTCRLRRDLLSLLRKNEQQD